MSEWMLEPMPRLAPQLMSKLVSQPVPDSCLVMFEFTLSFDCRAILL